MSDAREDAGWCWDMGDLPDERAPEIPGYTLGERLGAGGMGSVFRATDQGGRAVAIKVLLRERMTPAGISRFERETQLLARIQHPGVVAAYGWGSTARACYLVCELIEGQELDAAARDRPFAARLDLVEQAARALGALHAGGVVHRDLKPSNLLVDRQGRVKLIDLGVSTAEGVSRLTRTGQFLGTPYWAPPERIRGGGDADQATGDVWALGAIAYELLTGAHPYPVSDMAALLRRGKVPPRSPRELEPQLSPALEAVLLRALSASPDARQRDGSELASELALARRARSGRGVLVLGSAGLALLALALGAGLLLSAPRGSLPGIGAAAVPSAGAPAPAVAPASSRASGGETAFALLGQAEAKCGSGDRPGARGDLDRALSLDPSLTRAWHLRARLRDDMGDREGALTDLDRALALEPDRVDLRLDRAALRRSLSDPQGALADVELLIGARPDLPMPWFVRGNLRWDQRNSQGALDDFTRALQLDPRLAEAWTNRGVVRMERGDLEGALGDLNRALDLAPLPVAILQRGRVYRRQRSWDEALRDLSRAVELLPTVALGWIERAQVYATLRKMPQARADLDRAVSLAPRDAHALSLRGRVRNFLGDPQGALQDLNLALQIDPRRAEAWLARAEARDNLSDLRGALGDMHRSVELQPRNGEAWVALGLLQARTGQEAEARASLRRGLDLEPGPEHTKRARDELARLGER